jgi:dTMP kinase
MSGFFISFEGIDGAGKSTQIARLHRTLTEKGLQVRLTREPGGTVLSEKIRGLLLQPGLEICSVSEMLLYAAARAQIVEEVVRPALFDGKIVLSDRYIHSSIAYQGAARGLGEKMVMDVNSYAIDGLWPDLTFLFLLDEETARSRRKGKPDRLEQDEEFMRRVDDAFRSMAERSDVVVMDASLEIDDIAREVWDVVGAALLDKGFVLPGA